MTAKALVGFLIVGGVGFLAYEILTGKITGVVAPLNLGDSSGAMTNTGTQTGFLGLLAAIESGGNANAKNPHSSASGLYQFTKATAQALGLPWGNNPALPFGGAAVSVAEQNAAAQTLVDQNASILSRGKVALTNATLYAAHFLGAPIAVKVLTAPVTAALSPLIGSAAMTANGFPASWTVQNFLNWLSGKTGG